MYLISLLIALAITAYFVTDIYRKSSTTTEEELKIKYVTASLITVFAFVAVPFFSLVCIYLLYADKSVSFVNKLKSLKKRIF